MLIYPVRVRCDYILQTNHSKKTITRKVFMWPYGKLLSLLMEVLRNRREYRGGYLEDIHILFGFDHNGKVHPIEDFSLFLDPNFLDIYDEQIKKSDALDGLIYVNRSIFVFEQMRRRDVGNAFIQSTINRLLNIVMYRAAVVAQEKIRQNKNNPAW